MRAANDNPPELTERGLSALLTEARAMLGTPNAPAELFPDLCKRLTDALLQLTERPH